MLLLLLLLLDLVQHASLRLVLLLHGIALRNREVEVHVA